MKRLLLGLLALTTIGCNRQYSDFFPYHDNGTPKPHVALVPMMEACKPNEPWDVSKDFSMQIRNKLMHHGRIFVPTEGDLKKQIASTTKGELVNSKDLMPFLYFQPAHFVVVTELVDYEVVPYKRGAIKPLYVAHIPADQAEVLKMKVRLRIIDIRGGEPKLIRQEMVDSNHMITKEALKRSEALHGTEAFQSSELGIAYGRLINQLVEKIEKATAYQA